MTHADDAPPLDRALWSLDRGHMEQALRSLDRARNEPGSRASTARLLALIAEAHLGRWREVEARLASLPRREASLRLSGQLATLARAAREGPEAALEPALASVFLPRRLVPLDEAMPAGVDLDADPLEPVWWVLAEHPLPALPSAGDRGRGGERPGGSPDPRSVVEALLDDHPGRAAGRLETILAGAPPRADLLVAHARLLRLDGQREAARRSLDLATAAAPGGIEIRRIGEERSRLEQDDRLRRAARVVVRRGDRRLVVRRERGILLTVSTLESDAAESGPRWMEHLDQTGAGATLVRLVNDYLDSGYEVDDSSMDPVPEDDLLDELASAQEQGDHRRAMQRGREILLQHPDDLRLVQRILPSAAAVRGFSGAIPLSQRILVMGQEPDWALRQHAALLWQAGHVQECQGILHYLQERYQGRCLVPSAWALLSSCHVIPRHHPAIAAEIVSQGLGLYPGHPSLLEVRALSLLWSGDPAAALDTLLPLLDRDRPSAVTLRTGILAHLDGEIEGAEHLVARARRLHPGDPRLDALADELEGRASPALRRYRTAIEEADSPMSALALRLDAMRAAYRLSAYEDGLRWAREAQTAIGGPDARCLEVIYECLSALEPGEVRDDLAQMAHIARSEAGAATLTRELKVRSMLAAGLHLDPAALEPLWEELNPALHPEPLPAGQPEVADGLLCCATQTGCMTLHDTGAMLDRLASPPWDWIRDPLALGKEVEAGRMVVAPVPSLEPCWILLSTQPPVGAEEGRYAPTGPVSLEAPSGQIYVGPAEALHSNPEFDMAPQAVGVELGGRFLLVPPGRYRVRTWLRTARPWPANDVRADPPDVVFQLEKG